VEPETGNTAISLGTHGSLHPNQDSNEKNTLQPKQGKRVCRQAWSACCAMEFAEFDRPR